MHWKKDNMVGEKSQIGKWGGETAMLIFLGEISRKNAKYRGITGVL
jgi:hypothetical protein